MKNIQTHEYDYLVVGAGLYGAVFAHLLKLEGKKCLVIDKRDHTVGNLYCENIEGINVHKLEIPEILSTLFRYNEHSPLKNI